MTYKEITEKKDKRKMGKAARAAGKRFELQVRKNLELRGFVVCKWTNTVEFDDTGKGKLMIAKSKYNPFLKRVLSEGQGWPDFIAIRHDKKLPHLFDVIGVESKKAKYLDAKEKKMGVFLLENKIFSRIYVAYPVKEGRRSKIIYQRFEK
jgi:hypothetical protein